MLRVESATTSRTTAWSHAKKQMEDQEREEAGLQPKKRNKKVKEFYGCRKCGKPKNKETNHTQYKGNWYCPYDPDMKPFEEWKADIIAAKAAKKK